MANEEAPGEGGTAARPTGNKHGLVVSKRPQNESDLTDERSAREGKRAKRRQLRWGHGTGPCGARKEGNARRPSEATVPGRLVPTQLERNTTSFA